MKTEKQDWEYRYLDEKRQAIIEAAPSPMREAIDLAAAISALEDLSEHLSRRRQEGSGSMEKLLS